MRVGGFRHPPCIPRTVSRGISIQWWLAEFPGLRETLDHKDPQVRRVLKASRVSQVFRVLPVHKAPKDLRARQARRVTKERGRSCSRERPGGASRWLGEL